MRVGAPKTREQEFEARVRKLEAEIASPTAPNRSKAEYRCPESISTVDLLLHSLPPTEAHEAGALGDGGGVFSQTPNGCRHRWIAMCLRAEDGTVVAGKIVLKMVGEMGISCGIRRKPDYHRYNSFKPLAEDRHGRDGVKGLVG